MKKSILPLLVVAVMVLSSCSAIAGIFKAGAAVGIIAVVVVILVIIWVISLFRGKSN
ncbi:MAG: phosphatidate cytidylyltransferase [Sphingobacteriaceae bacterium]|nr:MAG: phosphatidate cytidylyltransferase [Sphingobacteriaceae bacterium]